MLMIDHCKSIQCKISSWNDDLRLYIISIFFGSMYQFKVRDLLINILQNIICKNDK